MSNIKLVVLDYDGTLIGSLGVVSEKTKSTLKKVVGKGVRVSISTGRSAFSLRPLIKELKLDLPHVFLGGSLVENPLKELILTEEPMSKSAVLETIEFCQKNTIYLEMATARHFYKGPLNSEFRSSSAHAIEMPEEIDLTKIAMNHKLLIMRLVVEKHHSKVFFEFSQKMKDQLNFQVGVPFDFPDLEVVNVTDISVSKISALRHVCQYLKISPEETMAIGDSPIDMPLIENVGLGIAMANAKEEVKKKAKWITADVDEDGVALALEKYILQ